MDASLPQARLIDRVRRRCREDARVWAALMYGSFAKDEGDRHSDVEFYVFVDDDESDAFDAEAWVASIAPLLAFFVNEFGTHVAVFDGLVRGEFHFEPHGAVDQVRTWTSVEGTGAAERMLVLDRVGTLTALLSALRPDRLEPAMVQERLDRLLNWLLLGCHVLARGERARALDALGRVHVFLLQLVRAREGSLDHWLTPSRNAERELSAAANARFRACTADLSPGSLETAYCEVWSWSRELATELVASFAIEPRDALARQVDARLDAWLRR